MSDRMGWYNIEECRKIYEQVQDQVFLTIDIGVNPHTIRALVNAGLVEAYEKRVKILSPTGKYYYAHRWKLTKMGISKAKGERIRKRNPVPGYYKGKPNGSAPDS